MDPASAAYSFPSDRAAREALAAVQAGVRWTAPRRIARRMSYLDTVDWRLFREGARLAVAWEGESCFLLWRPEAGAPYTRRPIEKAPEFCWDIPYPDLREPIGAIVEVRRLLPTVEVRLEGRVSGALDARDKTVVELVIERATAERPGAPGTGQRLDPLLRVIPVLGYAGPYERMRTALGGIGSARPEPRCLLECALSTLGIAPVDPVPKRAWTLRPEMRTDEAMKIVLVTLYRTMRDNEDGTRRDVDSEFLHDFRVAVRRTRSGLGQVREVFPLPTTRRFRREFSWLGQVTGPVRDLDVYLLALPGYREWLPAELRGGLDPIERQLRNTHRREHRALVAALDTRRYQKLCLAWSSFLERPLPARTTLPNARRPVVTVASERIARAHARVIRRGSSIGPESAPRELHRMRIECKKLRYLLEFFADLYESAEVAIPVGALKKLQNNLGEHNDLTVQRAWLLSLDARSDGFDQGPTRQAIEQLVRCLEQRQAATREEFQSRFDAFREPTVDRVFRDLFADRCA